MDQSEQLSVQVRELADRVNESGVAALTGLIDLASPRLLRLAVTITRNQHDAEDAIQAVFMRIAAEPKLLSRADRPWPYLLRMARNEALILLRKKKHVYPLDDLSDLVTRRSVYQLDREDTHRAVWTALRKLPREQSEVVVLKVWEAMTFLQIAEVLELNASTVASRYRYALQKLARCLQKTRREALS